MKELRSVLRNRNLGLLLTGRAVSATGDWFYQIALSVAIYKYSGGNDFAVGMFWIVRLVPALVLGPFAGRFADRIGYRRAMMTSDFGRMFFVLLLALLLRSSTWQLIYPLAFCVTVSGTIFWPASVALIPSLVRSPEERLAANAASMEAESVASIVGSAIAGLIAGAGFITQSLLIDAATFAVSAGSLWLMRIEIAAPVESQSADEEEDMVPGGVIAGFVNLFRRPLLLFMVLVLALPQVGEGALNVWIVSYAEHALRLGNAGIGYLYSAVGVGAVVGGIVAATIGGGIRLDILLTVSAILAGLFLAVFGLIHLAVIALMCVLLIGIVETTLFTAHETLLQQAVPEGSLGQVSGTLDSLFFNLTLVGTLASGILSGVFGLEHAIVGLGLASAAAAGLAWWNLRRQTAGQPDADGLSTVPAFEHVPADVRGWAVRRMVRERYRPGEVIIRQGELGDRFYTLARGHVAVELSEGEEARTRDLAPGDFFGEIALLKDIPRTATVRALDRVTVWSMSREDFEELQARAAEFHDSLWETANQRLEEGSTYTLALMART